MCYIKYVIGATETILDQLLTLRIVFVCNILIEMCNVCLQGNKKRNIFDANSISINQHYAVAERNNVRRASMAWPNVNLKPPHDLQNPSDELTFEILNLTKAQRAFEQVKGDQSRTLSMLQDTNTGRFILETDAVNIGLIRNLSPRKKSRCGTNLVTRRSTSFELFSLICSLYKK